MKNRSRWIWTLLVALGLGSPTAQAQLGQKKTLTLDVAKQVAAVASATAAQNKWTMVVTIVDDGGNIMYLERMDETQLGSIEVALAKARSAVSFKRPTKAFEDAVAGGRNAILKVPGTMPIEGGIPLMVDGKVLGAIGVSGGSAQEDGVAAKAAADAFAKIAAK